MYYQVNIPCEESLQEILIGELYSLDFDSFGQTDNEIWAYIQKEKFDKGELDKILKRHLGNAADGYEVSQLEEKNWNEEWEKNFDPVIIDDQVAVRASFHRLDKTFPFEILINPKMSFGTGHHETTTLMLKSQVSLDHRQKRVLDSGTGTGILAIMAAKLGASDVVATDIDEWSIENSRENFEINGFDGISLHRGVIDTLMPKFNKGSFDIILANITKNVLIHDIPFYSELLTDNGKLLLSGLYDSDIQHITVACEQHSLNLKDCQMKNNWACVLFEK